MVLDEAAKGDTQAAKKRLEAIRYLRALDVDEEARGLARRLTDARAIPPAYPEDALHAAIAAANGMDFLLTWNFTHLNNAFTRSHIRQVIESAGLECPEICSPEQFVEGTT